MREPAESAVAATGFRQGWGVFAPNPTRTTHMTRARIVRLDGSEATFEVPHPGPWLGSTRSERWRKWETRAFESVRSSLRLPTAQWLTDEYGGHDEVATVELIHLSSESPDPLTDEQRTWQSAVFYRYDAQEEKGSSVSGDPIEVDEP